MQFECPCEQIVKTKCVHQFNHVESTSEMTHIDLKKPKHDSK